MTHSDSGLVLRSNKRVIDKHNYTSESPRLQVEQNKSETESTYNTIPFL